ncbi:MAG: alpha/beta hydrolase [Caulobacterales bacterium]
MTRQICMSTTAKSFIFAGLVLMVGCNHPNSRIVEDVQGFSCSESLRICDAAQLEVVDDISDLTSSPRRTWSVGILQSYGAGHTTALDFNRVVVYFHGGPRVPFINQSVLQDLIDVFGDETTLIASVAYSGTELPNFDGTRRLRQHHFDAIEQDVLLVAQYIRSMQRDSIQDLQIVLVGSSFGAVPALRLASELGDETDALILASPWLFPLSINDSIDQPISYTSDRLILASPNDRELLRKDVVELYRDYFELSAEMNGSSPGERYLEGLRAGACGAIEQNTIVFIAQHEDRSNVALTREYFERCAGPGSVFDVQPAFHGMELSFPWVRQQMRDFAER